MKIFAIVLALLSAAVITLAVTKQSKPLPTQAAEAMQPLATQLSKTVTKGVNDFMAGTPGPVGDAARRNQQQSAAGATPPVRTTRRTMTECLKPGDLIDEDVKECIEGKRARDW